MWCYKIADSLWFSFYINFLYTMTVTKYCTTYGTSQDSFVLVTSWSTTGQLRVVFVFLFINTTSFFCDCWSLENPKKMSFKNHNKYLNNWKSMDQYTLTFSSFDYLRTLSRFA